MDMVGKIAECSEQKIITPDVHKALSDLLFLPDREINADATLILGMTLWQRPLRRALELYRTGAAGRLIFSGGYNAKIGRPEAVVMSEEALRCGIKADDMLVESRSSNTHENLTYCRDMLLENGSSGPCRVNIVAIGYHMCRAVLTAQAILPAGSIIGTASYPSIHYSFENWHMSERGRNDVLTEFGKIAAYFPDHIPPALKGFLL